MTKTKVNAYPMQCPKKKVKCSDCGFVFEIPKVHSLKYCICKSCGSFKVQPVIKYLK